MTATETQVKERPILFSITTGKPSQRGKRLKSADGLSWKQRNRESVNARRRAMYPLKAEAFRKKASAYRKANPIKVLAYNAKWRRKFYGSLRREMVASYGGCCACCGESEFIFLDLDHTNNDGKQDRLLRGNSQRLMVWMKANGWPRNGYQLLCCNCNQGKARNGGVCPHKHGVRCAA